MGKIGLFESLIVIVGLLWVFGVFRMLVVAASQNNKSEAANPSPKSNSPKSISEAYGKEAEFTDYEEIE